MYSYLKGYVTEIEPEKISLEVNNIGYHVVVPNPFEFKKDILLHVYIYQHIKEDSHTLYGFIHIKEKRLFEQLISVKGIGPKSALAVLAAAKTDEIIRAIEMSDTKYLNKFPGIGPKASQQIVLDLKGKIQVDARIMKASSTLGEVDDALRALGYKAKEIDRVTKDLDSTKDTSTLVKDALRKIAKK